MAPAWPLARSFGLRGAPMSALITLPLAIVLLSMIGRWIGRARRDAHSIESHHHSLDVLEDLSGRAPSSSAALEEPTTHVRIVPRSAASPPAPRAPSRRRASLREPPPAVPPSLPWDREVDRQRIVFVDGTYGSPAAPAPAGAPGRGIAPSAVSPAPAVAPAPAVPPARDGAPAAAVARRRSLVPPMPVVASAVLILLVAAVAGSLALPKSHSGTHLSDAPPASVAHQPLPPATHPARPRVTPTSSGATEASYAVASGPVQLSLFASGVCWVELRTGSQSGPIMFEGTLEPGVRQTFQPDGNVWLRLGDPGGVQLQVDGITISLPASAVPYDVMFTGASQTSPGA